MARPVVSGLFTPDDTSARLRRVFAGLGVVAALLALLVVADWLTLGVLTLACIGLTGYALCASDQRQLVRFGLVNGVAMLLLTWAATEGAELVIQRTPDQLEVTLNGVRLAASTAGIDSPLNGR